MFALIQARQSVSQQLRQNKRDFRLSAGACFGEPQFGAAIVRLTWRTSHVTGGGKGSNGATDDYLIQGCLFGNVLRRDSGRAVYGQKHLYLVSPQLEPSA